LIFYDSGNRRGTGRDVSRARWYAQRGRIRGGPRPYPTIYTNVKNSYNIKY